MNPFLILSTSVLKGTTKVDQVNIAYIKDLTLKLKDKDKPF
jgi:hypothetical protein